jgi:hypothetical protein
MIKLASGSTVELIEPQLVSGTLPWASGLLVSFNRLARFTMECRRCVR